ncbi:MAG: hypothetical protein JJ992_00690 [Planctomycetes bacterium]|nr:hypothetical protein [Planctomycetota bacterium]
MSTKKLFVTAALVVAVAMSVVWLTPTTRAQGKRGFPGQVYVSSQGLYYDTFVAADKLPPHGRFQLLVDGVTDFGPGDPGYLGGRWMVPNANGGFDYFLCPLIPPGHE